jgi:small subunit ribosomal protein S19
MTRSIKKGPYIDEKLLKKIEGKKPLEAGVINTWARSAQIAPEMVGFTFGVHNGRVHIEVLVTEDMVGHRLGEFSPTRKFVTHGGKMQKEIEAKKKQAEIDAAKAAWAVAAEVLIAILEKALANFAAVVPPIPDVNSEMLFENISSPNKYLSTKETVLDLLKTLDTPILLTMGAGDIDTLVPQIKLALS